MRTSIQTDSESTGVVLQTKYASREPFTRPKHLPTLHYGVVSDSAAAVVSGWITASVGRERDRVWHVRRLAAAAILGPGLRQIQGAIQQRVTARGTVVQKQAGLKICHTA